MLYSYDLGNTPDAAIVEMLSDELALPKSVVKTIQERVKAIRSHLQEIDKLIAHTSQSYEFERIQTVEKNILRLGIYELLYTPEIPQKVVFAECKRLATKFSTKEASIFINAILDAILKRRQGTPVDKHHIDQVAHDLEESEKNLKEAIDTMEILPDEKEPKKTHE